MKNALIVKYYGDPDAVQLAEGIIRIERANAAEMDMLRKELAHLKAERDARSYSDRNRYAAMIEAIQLKYPVRPLKPVAGALLTAWAALILIWDRMRHAHR